MSQSNSTDREVVSQMCKREERMVDGRLLIYYTFESSGVPSGISSGVRSDISSASSASSESSASSAHEPEAGAHDRASERKR